MPNISTNTKVLTARFKGKGSRPYSDFIGSPAILISVGQEKSQGQYLESTLMLTASEIFYNHLNSKPEVPTICYIIVTGALYGYNIAVKESLSEEEAYKESLRRAEKWIKDCEDVIAKIFTRIPELEQYVRFEFIRYKDLIQHELFQEHLVRVRQCLQESTFQEAMNISVGEYSKRQNLPANGSNARALIEEASSSFLLYESAGFSLMSKIYPFRRMIYTSFCTHMLKATIEHPDLVNNAFDWWEIRHNPKTFTEEDGKRLQSLLENKSALELINDSDNRNKFLDTALLRTTSNLECEQKKEDIAVARTNTQHTRHNKPEAEHFVTNDVHYESTSSQDELSQLREVVSVQTMKISELSKLVRILQEQLEKMFNILNQSSEQNLPRKNTIHDNHHSFLKSSGSQESRSNGTPSYRPETTF